MTKIKDFFKQKDVYIIISAFFVLFAVVAGIITGVYPFGPNTNATYDAWHQVCPLYNLIFDFFEGKSSLFYSTNVGGGINTFGVLAYYIVSPFSFLFLIFGRGGIYYAYTLVMLLKVITTSVVACFFIRKTFPKINKLYQIVLSVLYATGGYFVFLHTWITWIDFMIYMPLLFMAYKKLVNEEKFIPFSILMALLIFTCFGIGSFSFIPLFILFVAYNFICLDKEKQKRTLTLTIIGLLIAIGIALFLLVPSFLQYLNSSRTSGFFKLLFTRGVFSIYTSDKLATVIGDGILLFFAILFIVKCDKTLPKNKFLIFAFILLLFPVVVDETNLLLNMGSYNAYAGRLGFVYSFLIFYMAASYINEKWADFVGAEKSNKRYILDFSVIGFIYFTILALVFLTLGPSVAEVIAMQGAEWVVAGVYLVILLLLIIPLSIIMFNTKTGHFTKKSLTIIMVFVSILQCIVNFGFSTYGGIVDYSIISDFSQIIQENNIASDEYIKDTTLAFSRNVQLDIGLKSYSIFSSSTDSSLLDLKGPYAYITNNTGVSSYGGTVFSDAIFGYRYLVSDKEENRPYLTLIDTYENDDETARYLYENSLVLNGGYIIDKGIECSDSADFAQFTNDTFVSLGGEGEIIKRYSLFKDDIVDVTYNNIELKEEETEYKLSVKDTQKEGFITIKYVATEDSIIYVYSLNRSIEKFYTLTDIEKVEGFRKVGHVLGFSLNDLGFVKAGETVSVDIRLIKDVGFKKTGDESLSFAVLDYEKTETLINKVIQDDEKQFDVTANKNGFTINTTQTSKNNKLIFAHPYSENYVCTINGESIDIKNVNGAIEIDLLEGENKIELVYKNKYTKLMLVCLGIGVVLVVGIILVMKFFKEKILKFSKIFRILSFALAIVLLAFFYVFPLGTMLVKMCLGMF